MSRLDLAQPRASKPLPLGPALRAQQSRALQRRIAARLSGELTVILTDNRAVMISVQRDPRHHRYHARLHHLFAEAPDPIVSALARYIASNDRQASKELNGFIDENQEHIRPSPQAPRLRAPLRTTGRCHDLQRLLEELNQTYFGGSASCQITWGRQIGKGRSRRSIKVGSYSLEENLIRIHPGLDQEWIPPFYVRWVIFHELLHAVRPAPRVNGRHLFHTPEFAAEEQRFLQYSEATAWERRNLAALLCI